MQQQRQQQYPCRCSTASTYNKTQRIQFDQCQKETAAATAAAAAQQRPARCELFYHVLYTTAVPESNISLESIQASHLQMQQDFNLLNPDTADVPVSGNYGFAGVRGSADIQLEPSNHLAVEEEHHVVRVDVTSVAGARLFTNAATALTFEQLNELSPPRPRSMNFYVIPNLQRPGPFFTAGAAELFSNQVWVVHNSMMSGGAYRGNNTHAMGHAFGLHHPFADNNCTRWFEDVPPTRWPNYEASRRRLLDLEDDGQLDNHHLDVLGRSMTINAREAAPFSCTPPTAAATEGFEQFMNFMDLGTDQGRMFSISQCNFMRTWVAANSSMYIGAAKTPATTTARNSVRLLFIDSLTGRLTIKNFGDAPLDIRNFWVRTTNPLQDIRLEDMTLESGNLHVAPQGIVTVSGLPIDVASSGIGLFRSESTASILDFMQWGGGAPIDQASSIESIADSKSIWTAGTFVNAIDVRFYKYIGNGETTTCGSMFWISSMDLELPLPLPLTQPDATTPIMVEKVLVTEGTRSILDCADAVHSCAEETEVEDEIESECESESESECSTPPPRSKGHSGSRRRSSSSVSPAPFQDVPSWIFIAIVISILILIFGFAFHLK